MGERNFSIRRKTVERKTWIGVWGETYWWFVHDETGVRGPRRASRERAVQDGKEYEDTLTADRPKEGEDDGDS